MKSLLSIIIPAFNEEKTIGPLLSQIREVTTDLYSENFEIIVIDDGSNDNTSKIVSTFSEVKLIKQKNQGKGNAVRTGIAHSKGNFILIQDADTEYSPFDYPKMIKAINHKHSVVYGSRVLGSKEQFGQRYFLVGKHPDQSVLPYLFNRLLSLLYLVLFGRNITDSLTGYKLYPESLIRKIEIRTNGFETDHEITCKLLRLGYEITEVPIRYKPRTKKEGKKITSADALIAIVTILRFRLNK